MSKFVVSARKYRPTTFKRVVGQSHIVTTLQNALRAQQLAQALLFCGPKGTGKTTCARIFAKAINCLQLTADTEPCNVCASCKSFNERTSFNISELDAASNNSVEDIRSLVDQVRYPPQNGKYKVYIIDEVHMLSQAAFNAFLKTLEEPPSYAIFILATTEKYKVIPTILSRCQIYDFHPIKPEIIVQQLKEVAENEQIAYDEEALHYISQKAEGALRDALSMFDVIVSFGAGKLTHQATIDTLHILDYSYYFRLTEAILAGDIGACLLIYDEIVRAGFDGFYFIEGLVGHFRSLLVAQDPATLPLLGVPTSVQEKYFAQSQAVGRIFILDALDLVNQCAIQYKESINKRFHVELTLIALAKKHTNLAQNAPGDILPDTPIPSSYVPNSSKDTTQVAASVPPPQQSKKSQGKSEEAINNNTTIADSQLARMDPSKDGNHVVSNVLPSNQSNSLQQETKKLDTPPDSTPVQAYNATELSTTGRLQSTIRIPQLAHIKASIETFRTDHAASSPDVDTIENKDLVLTEDLILPYWQAYAQQLKANNKMPAYSLMNRPIELEGNTILLKFTNAIEEHILAEIKEGLVNHLRKQLLCAEIEIKGLLAPKEVASNKPYTAQEKFRYLVSKNSYLQLLKEQLQLEIID